MTPCTPALPALHKYIFCMIARVFIVENQVLQKIIFITDVCYLFKMLAQITESTGEKRTRSFLFQSLSMNLQRGNALYVMGTVAHHRKLEEIYHLGTIPTEED